MKISVIGTGRMGTVLARALAEKGWDVAALFDVDRRAAVRSRRLIKSGRVTAEAAEAARLADIVFLCLPDGMVSGAAAALARQPVEWAGKTVFHTCGALSSRILSPLERRGAQVGSFHPAQSFARKDTPPSVFDGAAIAVEGDATAVALGRRLARSLGGKPFFLKPEDKPFYHAACSIASNLLVPLFDLACALLQKSGIRGREAEAILLPLVEGTVLNIGRLGRTAALTGPIARGDTATLRLHMNILRDDKPQHDVYRLLGARAVEIAVKSGLGAKEASSLRRRLAGK